MSLFALLPAGLVTAAITIAIYIFKCYGLWKMADECRVKHPWLACIPYADAYVMGAIADRYNRYALHKRTNYRSTMIILLLPTLLSAIGAVFASVLSFITLIVTTFGTILGVGFDILSLLSSLADFSIIPSEWDILQHITDFLASVDPAMYLLALLGIILLFIVALIVLATICIFCFFLFVLLPAVCLVVYTVLYFIVFYKICLEFDEKHAVLYLIITLACYFVLPAVFNDAAVAVIFMILHKKPAAY